MGYSSHTRGFTLIEILVSVAIFSVVMVMALGALLSLSVGDRKAQTLKSAIDNLGFAMDSISRSIRTGSNYHCGSAAGQDCVAGSNVFVFTTANGVVTYYRLESLTNDAANAATQCGQKAPDVGCIQRSVNGGVNWYSITAPDVVITDFSGLTPASYMFYVIGSVQGDTIQPKVVITITGYAILSVTQKSTFNLQTSVTQRIYDQ